MHPRPAILRLSAIAALCAAACSAAPAGDWPQFGGPHRDGGLPEAELPPGGIALETVWQRPLGSGYSGVVVAGDAVVTMHGDGESDRLVALDAASGETRWSVEVGETYRGHDGSDDGPLSTPLIHAGRIFAVTPRGDLLAVALDDGRSLWRTSLTEAYAAAVPEYGFATSPLAAGENVVVQVGGAEGHGLCAFDAATGELRWKIGGEAAKYRSPVPIVLAGRTQIVVVADRAVRGVDARDGSLLWEQTFDEDHFDGIANITTLPDGRFLVTGWERSRLFGIVPTDEGFSLEQRWETTELKQSYTAAVYRAGVIYGYSNTYLVAVDAESGERVWKSRPPGKGAPILVGDRLAVWAVGGKLVIGAARREGFEPEAQAEALQTAGLTAPAFADGTFYVRNLSGIAAVGLRKGPARAALAVPEIPPPTLGTGFGEFLSELEGQEGAAKVALLDAWLAAHERMPLIEGEIVHFLYRGVANDVGIESALSPQGSQSLRRVAGTDLFYRSFEVDPRARIEYGFIVDFGEPQPDPGNPYAAAGAGGDRSELRMPGWNVPDYTPGPGLEPAGKLEHFEIASEALGDTREVHVYLPPGYAAGGRAYPLLVVPDILGARRDGRMPEILDRLEGSGRPAAVLAFVPFSPGFGFWDEGYAARRENMVRFIADEMVPRVSERYGLAEDRAQRAIAGFGWGAFPALYCALARGDVFGNVAAISLLTYEPLNEEIAAMLADRGGEAALEVYAGWGSYDANEEFPEHVDLPEMNRQVASIVEAAGHHVDRHEIVAGPGWGSWWAHVGPFLQSFFE